MCLKSPKAPPAPPPPELPPPQEEPPAPPPADPVAVAEGVKQTRTQDKQKAAFLAGQNRKTKDGAAGLLTPAGGGASATETLIGG